MDVSRRTVLSTAGVTLFGGCLGGGTDGAAENGTTATTTGEPTGGTTVGEPTTTTTSSPSVTDVSLLLNWKPSGLHVPYYAARARGFYEQQGLTLSTIESGQGSDFSAKQVGLGNTPFAITSADQVVNVNSRELSPLSVGVVMQRSPVVLFTVREHFGEEFTAVEQLEGKRVGTGPGMVRQLSKLLLERQGVLGSVELVDTGYDTVQRLLSGDIDAAGGAFGDAVDARHQDYTTDLIRVADSVPSYGHVVATDEAFARDHPATVRAFLRATARGSAWAQQNPGAATDLLVEAVPALGESRARQRDKWRLMSEDFVLSPTVRENGWGWSTAEPWTTVHDALRDADLLGGSVDPDSVWTNEYLDADYEYIGSYAAAVSG